MFNYIKAFGGFTEELKRSELHIEAERAFDHAKNNPDKTELELYLMIMEYLLLLDRYSDATELSEKCRTPDNEKDEESFNLLKAIIDQTYNLSPPNVVSNIRKTLISH
eukprot:UN26092